MTKEYKPCIRDKDCEVWKFIHDNSCTTREAERKRMQDLTDGLCTTMDLAASTHKKLVEKNRELNLCLGVLAISTLMMALMVLEVI